ncbi:hypothetical protein D9611_014159 [Ephemerocybe angulata]|uniref:F-box domain-containing protein n=1 Tax=Ephemerocybe angulata TaxID=980116 RepID=A0A8H5C3F4_9AGAR|nr:hypothetical protein D9611_014159 [Tulosesus angulatus]
MDVDHGLSRILWSNDVPIPIEATSIRSEVETITSRISVLRAELEGLENRLRQHHAALSPVRRVPPEIIAQIFSILVVGVLDSGGRDGLLDLGLVCKSWRRAALSSHRLWAGVSVDRHQCNETSYGKIVTWLNRSGDLPRTLTFDHITFDDCECEFEDSEREEPCQMSNPALIKLLSVGPKLHTLVLQCSSQVCFRTLLESIGPEPDLMNPRPWDTLQSLRLELSAAGSCPWDEPLEASESLFYHLPQVTSLNLHIPYSFTAFEEDLTHSRTVALNVPPRLLQGLKTFDLRCDWQGNHILAMLQHCENLETLIVDFRGEALQYDEDDIPIVHKISTESRLVFPNLRTLHLESTPDIKLLDFLRAPSLRDLRFDMEYDPEDLEEFEFQEPLMRFLKVSNCQEKLQSLHLQNLTISSIKLARIFLDLPSLTTVIIDRARFDANTFWQQMQHFALKRIGTSDAPRCLPHLRELQTFYMPVEGPVLRAVAKFLMTNRTMNPLPSPCAWKVSYVPTMRTEDNMEQELAALAERCVSFQVVPFSSL